MTAFAANNRPPMMLSSVTPPSIESHHISATCMPEHSQTIPMSVNKMVVAIPTPETHESKEKKYLTSTTKEVGATMAETLLNNIDLITLPKNKLQGNEDSDDGTVATLSDKSVLESLATVLVSVTL